MPPIAAIVAVAVIAGVVAQDSAQLATLLVISTGLGLAAWIYTADHRWLITGVLVVVAMVCGAVRVSQSDPFAHAPESLSQGVTFTGTVSSVPREYPSTTFATVRIEEPDEARVWAILPPYPRVEQGDQVLLSGSFQPFPQARFRGFAAQHRTQGVLEVGALSVSGNTATLPQRFRNTVIEEVRARVRARIPEPAGAFMVGMLLGDDGAMTEATRHAFRVGGMTHLTAVSGLHIGVIAAGILLLSRVGMVHRWWLLTVAVPLIWTFAYVVGMRPSVVRASLMLTLFVIAQLLGRPRDTINAVAMAAALMILVDPSIRFDIGFQLSVAATLGIALSLPLLGERSVWHAAWVVPVAAEMAVTPLILYHFGYYSLVSPIANIVAAPFVAIAMALGILTIALSMLSGGLADLLAIAAWLPARSVVLIADAAAWSPVMSGDIEPLTTTGVWVAYSVLVGILAALYVVLHPALSEQEGDIGTLYRV